MHLIEPCCAPKHLLALRSKLGENGTTFFHGQGDLSFAELLPALLTRYSEVDMMIVTPSLPDTVAKLLDHWMTNQWMTADGAGKVNVIKHLTLITDLRKKKSPIANGWLSDNPFGDRLELHNVQQNDTAIILPDIAMFGNINLTYVGHFTALATKNVRVINNLRKNYEALCQ